MIRATQVRGQCRWDEQPADTVVLDFDDRHRRRMAMTGTRGLEFLLDLENAVALRGGDALVLEDGRLVEVVAAPEPLVEIRGSDPQHLVRVAWHLGDHVIEAMVKGLGARLIEIEAPFDPEGGAYAGDGHAHAAGDTHDHATHAHSSHDHAGHGHGHHHDHDHGHHHHHDEHCEHDHHHGHPHAHDDE
jgi:urease accessory protein